MKNLTCAKKNSQKGMALIIAIGFLAILSILGAVVLNVATQDIGVSAGFMPARQAFYTSDRAVEYSMNRDIIVNLTPLGSTDLGADNAWDADGNPFAPNKTHKQIIEGSDVGTLVSGTVEDLGPHDLPPTMAEIHGADFGANLYHIEVESTAPSGGGNMESRVNASIVRLYKLEDDTIFRPVY